MTAAAYDQLKKELLTRAYEGLNPPQREAVFCAQGPLLVLAGAGSGKTSVLTQRIAYLQRFGNAFADPRVPVFAQGDQEHLQACVQTGIDARAERLLAVDPVPPWEILAITFTNKAAREMRNRLEGMRVAPGAWVLTFHAACARILRRDIEKLGYTRSFTIVDSDDQSAVVKGILKAKGLSDKEYAPREVLSVVSGAKSDMLMPDEWFAQSRKDRRAQGMHDIYIAYQKRLREMNALDFDDLLLKVLELFAEHPPVLQFYRDRFRYLLVDEYQDTNHMQYMLVRLLAASRNVCVVGDDDQSIYGWRGADIRNILDFEKDYAPCKVVKLEQNYRSTNNILNAANQVIDNNAARKKKTLWSAREDGEALRLRGFSDEQGEAEFIAKEAKRLSAEQGLRYGDMAILYRANAQSRVPEEYLMKAGIPYTIYGGVRFYERKEVKDVIAYMRAVENPLDDISLRRVINTPRRGIGDTTVAALFAAGQKRDESFFSVMMEPQIAGLNARAVSAVGRFAELMTLLLALKATMGVSDFVRELIERTGITKPYEDAEDEESQARLGNIREMISAVEEYEKNAETPSLGGFLESAALVADVDALGEENAALTLMTLHSAKGLEFPVVFMVGMEEGVFPGMRSMMDEQKLEEERRLCYVGITRAMDLLYMTYAMRRMLYGSTEYHTPSRFLEELPSELIDRQDVASLDFQTLRGQEGGDQPRVQGHRGDQSAQGRINTGGAIRPAPKKAVPAGSYVPGDKVYHATFGDGTVIDVKGDTIKIAFPAQGIKVLSASIAPLSKKVDV